MRRWGRVLAALLCAVLLLGVTAGATGGTPNVYLMAVNDTVVEMTADNMPTVVDGVLYVPYTMLSSRVSGINLGVNAQYSANRQTVLVSSGKRAATYDIRANNAYDLQGNLLDTRAVVRNSMVYLPLAWVCGYFGNINYTTTRTRHGTLVRVTNSSVILSDAEFVDAADSLLRDNLRRYQESLAGEEPTVSEGPTTSAPPVAEGPLVYLALLCGDRAEEAARQLENAGQRGLFFFTEEQLVQRDELVRRLLGAGHLVGLELTGEDLEECKRQLQTGSRLLADVGRTAVTIVRADGLTEEGRNQLKEEGGAVWSATARGTDYASAGGLLRSLSARRDNLVELSCGEEEWSLTAAALRSLTGSDYRLRQTVAPTLG